MKTTNALTNKQLQTMLTACYELEGLISLALERKDTTPSQVWDMIRQRSRKLAVEDVVEVEEENVAPTLPFDDFHEDDDINTDIQEDEDKTPSPAEEEEANDALVSEMIEEIETQIKKTDDIEIANTASSSSGIKVTLGDKFLFVRELFDGNEADYQESLQNLSEMNSHEEIEDYLYNDLCFDEKNPIVKQFAAVVTARL